MDNRFGCSGFAVNASSVNSSVSCGRVGSGAEYHADTTLCLNSPGTSSLFFNLKGTKRKWDDINGTEGPRNASLALSLRCSSSSSDSSKKSSATAGAMYSPKETDDESSMDLGLSFHLNLGNENAPSPKKPAVATPKEPKFDLKLSLSVGPSQSSITSPDSAHHRGILDSSVMVGSTPTFDEGSTSSQWKYGSNLLPHPYASEKTAGFVSNQMIPWISGSVPAPDLSSNWGQMLKEPVASSSGITHPQQRSSSMKNCQFQGCGKGARGASGLCIAHGGGRRCQRPGCHKGAEGKTIYCKAHGGGRRCQYLGCTKSAEGRTDYCIAHGGGRRCSHEGCTRAARGKSGLCIRHGGGKRCQRENCTKSAEGQSGLCISHGGGRRCQYPQCTKGAQGSTMFCKAHGGGKRCTFPGCMKGAEGSTPFCKGHGGGKRCAFPGGCSKSVHGGTQFCVAHGGGKRCAVPQCTKSARGRTDFCVRHGGGKRCKSEGCGKSAQGSTDFCKAHGGGKRCSWGQAGSAFGAGGPPCDRFARGKIGLCAAHAAQVEDHRVHGGHVLGAVTAPYPSPIASEKMKQVVVDRDMFPEMETSTQSQLTWSGLDQRSAMQPVNPVHSGVVSLPEGRVHGGTLMAMLASNAGLGSHSGSQVENVNSEQNVPHTFVPNRS
ncbi:hypothetical protein COCNU_03G012560 [Cocos nucifera]|uniref:WRKY19-like zinc finger domain-containing protein n=1 Tax=Cocos nucifera TaxID=13894 RepID=A0A8K0I3H0_COCNU|nr:hypothetical protein COCNU_03G012560 [Cocos nucifera]